MKTDVQFGRARSEVAGASPGGGRRSWRRIVGVVALTGACLGVAAVDASTASAGQTTPTSPVSSDTYGATYGQWGARWWQWAIGTAVSRKGSFDAGRVNCGTGQPCASGANPVWFLAAPFNQSGSVERNCTVPRNVSLLVPVLNVECSDLEDDPFHGDTPSDRAECVGQEKEKEPFKIGELAVTLERKGGATWSAGTSELSRLIVVSPDVAVTAVAGNPAGVPVGTGFSTGKGAYVMLAPLARGSYVLTFTGTFPNVEFTATATYKLQVV